MKKIFLFSFAFIICSALIFVSCEKNKDKDKDTTSPIITLKGKNSINVNKDSVYVDAGATATDNVDGDITNKIVITNNVNISVEGEYLVKYNVTDNAGNTAAEVSRMVKVMIL